MNRSQLVVFTLVCAFASGALGWIIAQHIESHYRISPTSLYYVSGAAGYLGGSLIELFTHYMRRR